MAFFLRVTYFVLRCNVSAFTMSALFIVPRSKEDYWMDIYEGGLRGVRDGPTRDGSSSTFFPCQVPERSPRLLIYKESSSRHTRATAYLCSSPDVGKNETKRTSVGPRFPDRCTAPRETKPEDARLPMPRVACGRLEARRKFLLLKAQATGATSKGLWVADRHSMASNYDTTVTTRTQFRSSYPILSFFKLLLQKWCNLFESEIPNWYPERVQLWHSCMPSCRCGAIAKVQAMI
ncbi:hypothetical protein DFH94DRAFT_367361 [Russula ochroleuca]|uniref:Secreted protein n=1 Tax=Russula ochroleuca TaxID=152965 RepID=A0A9P5MZL0_9AGAM|nr:hypothetical protein DFH94DRAFT_367361 [Russula ochroleuca]